MHQSEEPIRVIADDRERSSGVPHFLSNLRNVELIVKRLPVGDYLADNRLLFERKTLQDFAVSVIDGRLFKQMIQLARSKHKAGLILEGTGKNLTGLGIRREALQGALITVSLILGIPILRARDASEAAALIVYAARQIKFVVHGFSRRPGYRPKTKRHRQLYILQGLPGVGRDRAQRLLETFRSVEAVMTAGIEDLQVVEGIGRKTAKKIKWAVSEELPPFAALDEFPV
jgi:DNA excision repair protein ERCC-4